MNAIELFKNRRTQYALNGQLPIERADLEQRILTAVREAPSAFNSQSSRVVVLFGAEHQKLWNEITLEALRPLTPPEQFVNTEKKMASFAAGAGTILFFEDQDVIRGLQEKFALYADKFPEFSANAAGIAQYAVWLMLAEAKIGSSLQHYNPVIDAQVQHAWDIPANWQLCAQMPFGGHAGDIPAKTYMDDAQRFRVVG